MQMRKNHITKVKMIGKRERKHPNMHAYVTYPLMMRRYGWSHIRTGGGGREAQDIAKKEKEAKKQKRERKIKKRMGEEGESEGRTRSGKEARVPL